MAKPPVRNKKAPSRRPWSTDDLRLLKGMARKEPLAKIAETLKRTAGATRQKATNTDRPKWVSEATPDLII